MNISITKGLVVVVSAVFGLLLVLLLGPLRVVFAEIHPPAACYPIADISRTDYGFGTILVGDKQNVEVSIGRNTLGTSDSVTVTLIDAHPDSDDLVRTIITPINATFDCTSPAIFQISSATAGLSILEVHVNGNRDHGLAGIRFVDAYPDDTLMSARGFAEIFIISDGKKWRIPAAKAMDVFGLSWSDVIEVDQGIELAYDFGGSYVEDGALVREIDSLDIWIVKIAGGKRYKRLILSPHVLNSYEHLRWENVIEVSAGVLDELKTSDLVQAVGDNRIFKLSPRGDVGDRQWIRSADAFTRNGFDWDAVYTINAVDRDSYTDGVDID